MRTATAGRTAQRFLPMGVLLLGALTTLTAVAFVFAPVRQPEVVHTWTPSDGTAVALPLMPYRPVALTVRADCAAARSGGLLLSTVPPRPDPAAAPLAGLTLSGGPTGVTVVSGGVALGTVALPAGDCTLALDAAATGTTVSLDGRPVLRHDGDARPNVAGLFTELPAGGRPAVADPAVRDVSRGTGARPPAGSPDDAAPLAVTVTADTRFVTTPTPTKLALALACVLALLGLGVALRRADRRWAARRVRLLPARWWRPRPVDGAVTALLLVWWAIGAGTVDDGYLAGIVRSRAENGFVGNVYRWLNAPEAPFSWFVEPYRWWSLVSPATPWMRLPSTLLGLLCWVLVSRLVLPRLGAAGRWRGSAWVAALAFGTWWVPFNLGLRPEPWVAVGAVLVFVAVERAVATGRVLPLAGALTTAGVTAALTPAGLMAFAPIAAAAVPLLRLLRARTDLQLAGVGARRALPLLAVLVAAPAVTLLLMAADQGAAALAETIRVRAAIGGGRPWAEESERYALLLTPGAMQGAIGRRAAVLTTVLAAAAVAWSLAGRGPRAGLAPGPTRRLLVTLALSAVVLTFTPTKWTQHFGDLAGVGTAVLALGLVASGRRVQQSLAGDDPAAARRRQVTGLAGVTAVGALVLAGQNLWPFVHGWYTPTFSTLPPQLPAGDVPIATLVIALGGAAVAAAAGRSVWRRAAGRGGTDGPVRFLPAPAGPMAAVLVAVLALQVASLARVAATHPDGYTPAADLRATLDGDPCGLQSALLVETDPAAGLLPLASRAGTERSGPGRSGTDPAVVPAPTLPDARPATVAVGGTTLPAVAVAGPAATAWYRLDARDGLPVVVTLFGATRPGDGLTVEFARARRVLARVPLEAGTGGTRAGGAEPVDRRVPVPPGADTVRLTVAASSAGAPSGSGPYGATAVASLPRVPVLTPMTEVLPPGTTAVLDWPVAFVFPCLTPAPLPPGTAGLARWRVGPPADDAAADITYTPELGGPFATARLLVTQHRLATYVRDAPTRDGPQLYRWDPVVPLRTVTPSVRPVDSIARPATPLGVPRSTEER